MTYVVDHIPLVTAKNRRPALAMAPTTITIHNTGNPTSTARNERGWLTHKANTRTASYHIVVDEREAIECIPLHENAWHAGDGSGATSGNRTSIGIEICESGDYVKALDHAVQLVARMLKERGWGVDRLRRHFDWSGKICPRLMYDEGQWTSWHQFKQRVDDAMREDEGVVELRQQIAELRAATDRVPAPDWFVREFGSADLGGRIHDPQLTQEGWRVLAIGLRLQDAYTPHR